jgi:hypothetical protein
MNDPQAVGRVDGACNRFDEACRFSDGPRFAARAFREITPVDEFHLEVRAAIVIPEGKDLDDVRVMNARDRLGFGEESTAGLR